MKTQKILIILVLALISISAGCAQSLKITTLEIISLHGVVISDDIEKAKLDISKGAWINLRNKSGWTALHYAVVKNSEKMIKLLIKSNADINLRDKKRGQTPLHFAVMTEKKQAVELLLANDADAYKKDINNKTPKRLAVLVKNKEILDLFYKYGY